GTMVRQAFGRINTMEPPPPWSIYAAMGSMIASFAAVVIGSFIALRLLNDVQYTWLVGWIFGAVFTIIFVFVRFPKPEERAVLRLGGGASLLQQIFLMLLIGVGLSVTLDIVSGRVTGGFQPEPELLRLYNEATVNHQSISLLSYVFAFLFMAV